MSLVLAVFFAAASVSVCAQTQAAPFALTESAALQQALQNNPSLLAARRRAEAANLVASGSPGYSAPVLKLGAVEKRNSEINAVNATERRAIAGLLWAPPKPGETDAKLTMARAAAAQAQAQLELEELNLTSAVRRAYRRLLVLQERMPVASEVEALETRLAGTEVALRQTSQPRANWPEPDASRDYSRRMQVRLDWDTTVAQLSHLLQEPALEGRSEQTLLLEGAGLDVASRLVQFSQRPTADLLAHAVATRPEVKAAAARCQGQEAQLVIRQADGRFSLRDVEVTYGSDRSQERQRVGVTAGFNLPFGGGAKNSSQQVAADRNACSADQAAVVASVKHQVQQEHLRLQAAVREFQAVAVYGLPIQEQLAKNARSLWQERRMDEARMLRTELRRLHHRLVALDHIGEVLQSDASLRAAAAEK